MWHKFTLNKDPREKGEKEEMAQPIIDEFSGLPCNSPPWPLVTVLYGPKDALDLLDQAA